MERWKAFRNGAYQVSDFGRVRRMIGKPKFIRQYSTDKGYRYVGTCVNGVAKNYFVATLVATAFIGPRPDGMEVNHKDLDKSNNHWDNLEYVTHLANIRHGIANGHAPKHDVTGERNPNAKLTVLQVARIRFLSTKGWDDLDIAETMRVSKDIIYNIVSGRSWAA